MKPLSILAAILATGALCAQDKPDDMTARIVIFGEAVQTSGVLLGQGVKDQANFQTGPGLRLMGRTSDESRWYWELAARFQSSAHMVTNRDISSTPPPNVLDVTKVKVYYSYWSVGAGYLFPLGSAVDFGLHLEGRGETINPKGTYSTTNGGTGDIDAHAVYFRPWVRASLDLKIKTGSVVTILGGEAGVAAIKTSQRAILPMSQIDDQTLRSMAPTWSGAVYAGIQF
ncbi:hypothetical protein GETHLI_21830 [Geothrix limicola]|uniref:Outer membrane protein beta-barrel domain-containing protein n=1 Tax=Geothrix limicola TaxID=2927978 RepID=A0ABQ5QGM2_9BACT|nr:hypothetical protein [Geothrix limicola]GLH73681.1 hypothetical protein GETHLI_21830 [Geothrix limicola]